MKQNILSQANFRRLLSLAISIALWMWVSNIKNPVVDLEYTNIIAEITSQNTMRDQYGLVITENEFPKVSVTLTGERELVTRVATQNIAITADVSHITEPGTYDLAYTVKLPFDSIQVKKSTPTKITITVDKIESTEIPLVANYSGTPKKDYYYPEINVQDTVHISAPSNILNTIAYAGVTVDISNRTSDLNEYYTIKFYDENDKIITDTNILVESDTVLVTGEIYKTADVELTLGYENEHISENINKISISPSKVEISGKPYYVDSFEEIEIGIISEKQYNENLTTLTFDLPEIEGILYTENETATATISYNKYISRFFDAFDYIIPSDVSDLIYFVDDEIKVQIYGNESDFNDLTDFDIKISLAITKEEIEQLEKGTLLNVDLDIILSKEFDIKSIYQARIQVK